MSESKLVYGRTTAQDRGTITTHEHPWRKIVALFREPTHRKITTAQYQAMNPKGRAHSKNAGLFFGGRCNDGHRSDSSLVSRSIVNLDLDEHCDAIWAEFTLLGALPAFEGLTYLVHSTRSHTDDTPKLRILIPLSREVTPAEYEPVARALAEMLDETMNAVARESYTPAQGMYFPSVSCDQEYYFASIDGEYFDPDTALERYPADDADTWPKRQKERVSVYVADRKMAHPEDKKAQAPIITAVHRAFDPWTFIDEFLGDIYIPSGDRYYPVGASGAPSVRIYDDAFIQSDHGSDPAVGQHNTFDLGRIHLFQDLDAEYDTAGMSPVEWPSYKAMVDFMLERPEVQAALAAVEDELADEKNRGMLDLLDSLGDELDDEDHPEVEDDLIGGGEPVKKKATIEDVLRRVRKSITKATSLDELDRRLDIIRAFPTADFRDLHRDLVSVDVQRKFLELTDEKITKATARKMLAPTVENLRDQVAGQEMPGWMRDWVFVTAENKFFNINTREMLSRDGFNGLFTVQTGVKFGVNNNGISVIAPADAALSVYNIPKPYKTRFHPGQPVLFEDEGTLLVNSYRPACIEAGSYTGNAGVKLLKRLLVDLFPEKQHREMVMDFLVHCVRYPEKKLKYALLVKGSENEGKTLLADLVSKLLGEHNCSLIGSDQLKDKFNGWAYERLFCVMEEIRMPGKEAHEVLNKLKPVATNQVIPVRRMNTDPERVLNFCNLYLTTNYEDCLPLEEDNSRYCVLFTRFRTNAEVKAWHAQLMEDEGRIYTRDLWDHIHERPGQFIEAFSKYTFSEHYDPQARAPDTVFKQIMAEDGRSEERQLFESMLESRVDPTITTDVLIWSSFRAVLDRKGMAPSLRSRAVANFLKPFGFVKVRQTSFRVDGDVRCVNTWTTRLDMLTKDYKLTYEGRDMVLNAITAAESLDDVESLVSNVVPFKPRN